MNKRLLRIISLLLVPCLLASEAGGLHAALTGGIPSTHLDVSVGFTCQAVNPPPLWEEHPAPPSRPNLIACAVRKDAKSRLADSSAKKKMSRRRGRRPGPPALTISLKNKKDLLSLARRAKKSRV